MTPQPPQWAYRLLERAHRGDPAGPAILGDLHEDFVGTARRWGPTRARFWYWREALTLTGGRMVRGAQSFLMPTPQPSANAPMKNLLGMSNLYQDARNAFRAVRHDIGFAAFATLIIGIGVGASTAVFSVINPLMLAPLPVDDPGQLVWVANDNEGTSMSAVTSRSGNLRDFRELNRSFTGITGYNAFFGQASYSLVGDAGPEQLTGADVAHDFLDVLGVSPLYGRNFSVEEGMWQGPDAVVLSHGFWMRRFGGEQGVVGTSIALNDRPYEVVGILPPSFDFSSIFTPTVSVDFLVPFAVSDETDRWGNTVSMIGRLAPGVTVEVAQADLDGIIGGLQAADPDRWGLGAVVTPLQRHIAAPFRAGMLLLAAAATTVMMIVCANLSNMLLARSPKRVREVAVRRTLGATRGRLVRQLTMESLLLSGSGAVVGLLIAFVATRAVSQTTGLTIPMLESVSIDGAAMLFTATLAIVAGIAIGVVPALQVSEGGEAAALKAVGGRSRGSRGASRLRDSLVVAEVALACVLLVLGGLFLRSFQGVLDVELGFQPSGAVAWQLNPTEDFQTYEEMAAFYNGLVTTVEAIPGVESAGLIDALPLGRNRTWGLRVVGVEYEEDEGESLFPHMVDEGYLNTMGISLLAGRNLTRDDGRETEPVVLINASGAARLFPGGDAVGEFVRVGGRDVDWRIVGVVGDVKHVTPELGSGTQIYFPMGQMWDFSTLDLVLRSPLPVEALAGGVSEALRQLDGAMPTNEYWTLDSTVREATSSRRFMLTLLSVFAATALLLAGLGIYGVLSYSVAERVPEIGIRMALGASASDVRGRVLVSTMTLALTGALIGAVASVLGSRFVGSLLFGVRPTDPVTFIGMISVLLVVAGLSGLIPAIRASRTDSVTALRS